MSHRGLGVWVASRRWSRGPRRGGRRCRSSRRRRTAGSSRASPVDAASAAGSPSSSSSDSSSSSWLSADALHAHPGDRSRQVVPSAPSAGLDVLGVGAVDQEVARPPAAASTAPIVAPAWRRPASRPSVSTVNEIATGRPTSLAARDDPGRLADGGQRQGGDHVRAGRRRRRGSAVGGRIRRPRPRSCRARLVAVAARPDLPADQRGRPAGPGVPLPQAAQERDGRRVDPRQPGRVVAEPGAPVRVGPPGRRLEQEPGPGRAATAA